MLRARRDLVAVLLLAGCDKAGNTLTLNATDSDGNVVASVGNGGDMAISVPGLSGKISLPRIKIDADDFDMNGVHLYPGSTITSMNVDTHDRPGKDDDSSVKVQFESPADPATVRKWFAERLARADFTLHSDGNGLVGTTDDKKPFRLQVDSKGAGTSMGTITMS